MIALGVLGSGLGIALSAASPAQAEVLYLQCGNWKPVAVDLANNTVDGHPATVTPLQIDWTFTEVPQGATDSTTDVRTNHLDRTTGALTEMTTMHWANGNVVPMAPTNLSCVKVSAPETKF